MKNKAKSLVDLVVTDSYPVSSALSQLLKKVDETSSWQVIVGNKALDFIKKNDGFTDEYKPLQKISSKQFDYVAGQAKAIWLATLPDVRGDYLAHKFNEHIKKDLKLNCPVYRMRLPSITEECVLNAILNKKNVVMDKEVMLKHEARLVIDHAINLYVSKLFSDKFPLSFDFGLHTGIILDYINKSNTLFKVSNNSLTHLIHPYDKEEISGEQIRSKVVEEKNLGRVLSLKDLYIELSGFVSWYGFGSCLQQAYSKGYITYPTSDTCTKTHKSFPIKKVKESNKNWGIVGLANNNNETENEIVGYISSEALSSRKLKRKRVLLEFIQEKEALFHHKYLIVNQSTNWLEQKYKRIERIKPQYCLGIDQISLLYYIDYLGFEYKQIPWIIYSLVKAGFIVYTSDATVVLTSLGKMVLLLLKNYVPILLKDKYVKNTLRGIKNLSLEDDIANYEFMQTRIDKVRVLTDSSYETIKIPKCSHKCICGKSYSIVINNTGVFATCSNNKCKRAGKIYPVDIVEDKIEVKDADQ